MSNFISIIESIKIEVKGEGMKKRSKIALLMILLFVGCVPKPVMHTFSAEGSAKVVNRSMMNFAAMEATADARSKLARKIGERVKKLYNTTEYKEIAGKKVKMRETEVISEVMSAVLNQTKVSQSRYDKSEKKVYKTVTITVDEKELDNIIKRQIMLEVKKEKVVN